MAVHDSDDLTGVFCSRVVSWIKNEHLSSVASNVFAWPIALASLDHDNETARLARKLGFGVLERLGADRLIHELYVPTPGNEPKGKAAVDPNRSLQLERRLPQTSCASDPTTWSLSLK